MDGEEIHGMLMYPCSVNMEDHEAQWKSSEFYTDSNFMKAYRMHKIAMQHTAECAKIYAVNNWKSVKPEDWSELNVMIVDNSGPDKSTKYYNHKPRPEKEQPSKAFERLLKSAEERRAKEHNPIVSVTDVVLDTSDGDFSITINGKDHLWIHNTSIIIIADFIEKMIEKYHKETNEEYYPKNDIQE